MILILGTHLRGAVGLGGVIALGCSLLAIALELWYGAKPSRYLSRWFLNDLLYTVFYKSGIWVVFIQAIVFSAYEERLHFLKLDVLSGLPMVPGLIVFWLGGDFLLYWVHRAQHRWQWLWAFHAVHHSPRELSALTYFRRHPVDNILIDFGWYFPLAFVLGVPTTGWVPLYTVIVFGAALQHSNVPWRFGPLYKFWVSPVFHSIHHSIDPAEYNSNYAAHFSIWDHVFGTASPRRERPDRFGIEGPQMVESIPVQLLQPFRDVFKRNADSPAVLEQESRVKASLD